MSEKRFIIVKSIENLYALVDKEKEVEQILIFSLHKEQLGVVCDLLNEQQSIIKYLTIEKHQADKRFQTIIAELKKENEQLRKQCFELEKDYLIETSDISDKIYLDDEIRELKQRYGV